MIEQWASRSCLTISKPKPRLAPVTRALHAFNAAMFKDECLVLSNNLPLYMVFYRIQSGIHAPCCTTWVESWLSCVNSSAPFALSNKTAWMPSKSQWHPQKILTGGQRRPQQILGWHKKKKKAILKKKKKNWDSCWFSLHPLQTDIARVWEINVLPLYYVNKYWLWKAEGEPTAGKS